jgi:ABC-type glycerol-3-phosphate transport system substrate-binding protein
LNTLLILTIILIAPLAAVPASRVMAQDSTTTITMWLDTTGGAENAECVEQNAVKTFNDLGNGTTVEATLQANSWDATRTAIAGGAGPDVVGTPGP